MKPDQESKEMEISKIFCYLLYYDIVYGVYACINTASIMLRNVSGLCTCGVISYEDHKSVNCEVLFSWNSQI